MAFKHSAVKQTDLGPHVRFYWFSEDAVPKDIPYQIEDGVTILSEPCSAREEAEHEAQKNRAQSRRKRREARDAIRALKGKESLTAQEVHSALKALFDLLDE